MDDLTEKLNEILNNPQEMEKLKSLAGMFGQQSTQSQPEPPPQPQTNQGGNNDMLNNLLSGAGGNSDMLNNLLSSAGGADGISSMLKQFGGMEGLSGLLGGNNSAPSSPQAQNAGAGIDPNMINSIMKIAPLLGSVRQEDDNTRLLRALRPLLKETRQKKLDDAIQMVQMLRILPLLKGNGIL